MSIFEMTCHLTGQCVWSPGLFNKDDGTQCHELQPRATTLPSPPCPREEWGHRPEGSSDMPLSTLQVLQQLKHKGGDSEVEPGQGWITTTCQLNLAFRSTFIKIVTVPSMDIPACDLFWLCWHILAPCWKQSYPVLAWVHQKGAWVRREARSFETQ